MADLRYKTIEEELQAAKKEFLENATKFFEDAEKNILGRIRWSLEDQNQAWAPRNMKLLLKSEIPLVILTGEEIRGQDKNPLEVILVDESSENIVAVGPESSATVEILLLKGESNLYDGDNWTVEQFNGNIVREVEGKLPLLAGNKPVKLQNGIGFLENIKFRHHAIQMRPPRFKLGARVIGTFDGVRIKEAKTESFAVKDFRCKYSRKHDRPSLSDEVFRLRNIRKYGRIEKRLQDHSIRTVEDFLIQRLTDPERLKKIVKMGEMKWNITVENARACSSDKKMSYYTNEHKTTGVVFYLSGQILGLYMEREYTPINLFSENQKADAETLLESACKNWKKVEPFEGEISVQHHFNDVGGHENAPTSEMNFPMMSQSSTGDCSLFFDWEISAQHHLNNVGGHENAQISKVNFSMMSQTGTGDCSLFSAMEITPNAFSPHDPIYSSNSAGTLFGDFNEF